MLKNKNKKSFYFGSFVDKDGYTYMISTDIKSEITKFEAKKNKLGVNKNKKKGNKK